MNISDSCSHLLRKVKQMLTSLQEEGEKVVRDITRSATP